MRNYLFKWASDTTGNIQFRQFFNSVNSGSDYYSTIAGGCNNQIITGSNCNFIGGGTGNVIQDVACFNVIGGGCTNSFYKTSFSGILGGCGNKIASASNYSSISGGFNNYIGGAGQTDYQGYSFIGGGHQNIITKGQFAVIGSGCNNTVSGEFSAVLGGSGNTVSNAYQYAGIFGQNINAVASNTFHVECLNAVNTPCNSTMGVVPVGTIFACDSGKLPAHSYPLYIQLA